MFNKHAFIAALTALAACIAAPAQAAEAYPERPIRFVVPFTAGGITDNVARTVGARAAELLGQPIIVENRAGAGGNIGTEYAANSKPDGYVIFLGTQGTQVTNPLLYTSAPSSADRLQAVQGLTAIPNIVVVNAERPYDTLAKLVDYARANPGKLNNSSAGAGTGTHLAAELFQSVVDVKFSHIPFKGSAPSITALIGGQVDLSFDYPVSTEAYVKAGKIRAVAVTGEARLGSLPDVPTLAELGYPQATSVSWMGVFVPAGTPDAVTARLRQAFAAAIAEPQIAAKLVEFGGVPLQKSGADFTAFVQDEAVKWGKVVKAAGVKLD